ncbi:hypothetical protein N7462_003071 [Penicillium macrosclerotiorum]|uniref:uncharacterized protein n=1 Tax=Penicillium macrosclerotiorum TaxID=303699 RepID=UPI0025499484|nr:uncharacterized protein N7462_003071 [Penicillium macrosclerotiorum]KAJ5688679.1 hypothetical protein N7462_003071 [Penicillium macrosclerotiorum]
MDPLSISASVAGLITISTQILGIIGAVKSKNKKGLESISREVTTVRGILCQIQEIIQFQSTKPTKSAEWLDTLNTTLDDCGETYLSLQKDLQALVSSSKLTSLKMKVKWTLKESDIQDALRKLESYKLSLDLLLSIQTNTATTNIEEILRQVQTKLSLKPTESPTVRTPLAWRQKLAGLDTGSVTVPTNDTDSTSSTLGNSSISLVKDNDTSFIIPGSERAGWDKPGFYGITKDEGFDAPDLNDPDLSCVCEMQIGRQKISLVCSWDGEEPSGTSGTMRPIVAHLLFKVLSATLCERVFAPVGETSLVIARCDSKSTVCATGELDVHENQNDFCLMLGAFALRSKPGSEQILVNFENEQDRDQFLVHLYAVRYLQRMDHAFASPLKLYHYSPAHLRAQHVQLGYENGTEKSYIYPYFYVEYSLESRSPRIACATKLDSQESVFSEDLSALDFQIVGEETIVFNTPDGSALRTISITFSGLNELFRVYYRLEDILQEWRLLKTKKIDEFEVKKQWSFKRLEFWEESKTPESPFYNVVVVAQADLFLKRMKMDVFDQEQTRKLASYYGMWIPFLPLISLPYHLLY